MGISDRLTGLGIILLIIAAAIIAFEPVEVVTPPDPVQRRCK
jgi:hypothetical protein